MLSITMATNDITPKPILTPTSTTTPTPTCRKIQFLKGLYLLDVGAFLAYMCISKYYCCQRFLVGICCVQGSIFPL